MVCKVATFVEVIEVWLPHLAQDKVGGIPSWEVGVAPEAMLFFGMEFVVSASVADVGECVDWARWEGCGVVKLGSSSSESLDESARGAKSNGTYFLPFWVEWVPFGFRFCGFPVRFHCTFLWELLSLPVGCGFWGGFAWGLPLPALRPDAGGFFRLAAPFTGWVFCRFDAVVALAFCCLALRLAT
jgi:hypothetical protein